mmetsp:Transcript_12819/g.32477  ORF Transcript_12819/g.32477 Transcript_12819/m.32477 type:complete len:168 (+) Transcript_12819:1886-2389(+)
MHGVRLEFRHARPNCFALRCELFVLQLNHLIISFSVNIVPTLGGRQILTRGALLLDASLFSVHLLTVFSLVNTAHCAVKIDGDRTGARSPTPQNLSYLPGCPARLLALTACITRYVALDHDWGNLLLASRLITSSFSTASSSPAHSTSSSTSSSSSSSSILGAALSL